MKTSLLSFAIVTVFFFASIVVSISTNREHKNIIEVLKNANTDLHHAIEVEQAKNTELQKRSHDRDVIEQELRECLQARHTDVSKLEDIKWQMQTVINTCPGRERPPNLPRP